MLLAGGGSRRRPFLGLRARVWRDIYGSKRECSGVHNPSSSGSTNFPHFGQLARVRAQYTLRVLSDPCRNQGRRPIRGREAPSPRPRSQAAPKRPA
jgi:hypothetical protein